MTPLFDKMENISTVKVQIISGCMTKITACFILTGRINLSITHIVIVCILTVDCDEHISLHCNGGSNGWKSY